MRVLVALTAALVLAAGAAGAQTTPGTPSTPGAPTVPNSTGAPTTPPPATNPTGPGTPGTTGQPGMTAVPDSASGRAAGPMGTARAARGSRTPADSTVAAQVDSVNGAARSGLTNLPVRVAGPLLESLQGRLAAMNNAALTSIASDLGALRQEIAADSISGARVGAILIRVGPKVTRAAAGQPGALRVALLELGAQLAAAGKQLANGQ